MKSFGRIAIAAMLAIVPMVAASAAWANTELVPGSRLVAPYWDISGDRSTLMLIANVSTRANLIKSADIGQLNGNCNIGGGGVGQVGSSCAVHLEFYDKTCQPTDLTIDLSKTDIDQLDLKVDSDLGGVRGLPSLLGWMDADVRRAITGSGHTATGVQANVLVGTVVITDSGSDFAAAYPMAAGIGSANSGIGADIVTRNSSGNANVWSGTYETFPSRVFVPMFFAEGLNRGVTFSSTLAIAGPAQSLRNGEAPGQDLGGVGTIGGVPFFTAPSPLIDADVDVYDACENASSDSLKGHYIFGTLDALFVATVTAPYNGTCTYPAADVDRAPAASAFQGGWIDIRNTRAFGQSTIGGVVQTTGGVANKFYPRGLVGVLVQEAATSTSHTGDATRLWGDCAAGNNTDADIRVDGKGCRPDYSLVSDVSHEDIKP